MKLQNRFAILKRILVLAVDRIEDFTTTPTLNLARNLFTVDVVAIKTIS
jgi:hypothetical protein